tara:strand:+ start:422 stop:814 length:393 start_codon:yes stop_codon:yes gene_type:complete
MTKVCNKCGEKKDLTEFYSNGYTPKGSKKYKPTCKPCEQKSKLSKFYSRLADILTRQGKKYECELCGYNLNYAALNFHHINPATKKFAVNDGKSRSLELLESEVRKCQLLCANCHAQEHNPHLFVDLVLV